MDDGSLGDESDNDAQHNVFDDTAHFVAAWDKRAGGRGKGAYLLSKKKEDSGSDKCFVIDVSGDGSKRIVEKSEVHELLGHEAMTRLKTGDEVFALDEELNTFYAARVMHSYFGSPLVESIDDDGGVAREVSRVFIRTKDEE